MNSAKKPKNRIDTAALVLLVLVMSIAFLNGALVYKHGLHLSILRLKCVRDFLGNFRRIGEKPKVAEPPIFREAPRQGPSEIFRKVNVRYPFTFIVYGDSREPAGDEKDAVIAKIIEENPDFVIHTGDLVECGEEHHWRIFDAFDGAIMDSGIAFYPVIGNHEYNTRGGSDSPDDKERLRHYFARFKFLGNKHWYSFKYGNSLFLMLDSSVDYLPGSHQHKWLMEKLREESPTFLFITLHHPPHTRGKGYHSVREPEKLLANLLENYRDKKLAKADIVFSGHVHNYERYRENDINYVVSGGGGAPQYPIEREPGDFYAGSGETFHYCRVAVSETEATLEMMHLDRDTGKWTLGDTFTVSK